MRILGRGVLEAFSQGHPDCREWLENWLSDAEHSRWTTPNTIKARYASASFLANNFVIFNVRGNNYRLEVRVAYQVGTVHISWMGTHAEYSRRHDR
jgi:mRNA interferase HigB